jgi:hypothetical protein
VSIPALEDDRGHTIALNDASKKGRRQLSVAWMRDTVGAIPVFGLCHQPALN